MSKYKKLFSSIIVVAILSSSFLPIFNRKAEAQWVTWDPGNFVPNAVTASGSFSSFIKDYALDTVAWVVANMIIERMSAATVNWINSGFKGSPAYVTDPEAYFQDLGDKIAGDFIYKDPRLNFLCGPISAQVKIALTSNYIGDRQWQCTLTDVYGNIDDFMGDFSRGGWDKFFQVTQQQQNNPIGAYIQAQNELSLQINSKAESSKLQLGWGTGFLSKKACARYDSGAKGETIELENLLTGIDAEGNPIYQEQVKQKLPDIPPKCIEEKIVTPGSVIENQLNDVLGLGNKKLVVADEFNEIISALLNQLVNRVVGGIGNGLRGASNPSNTGGSSFTDTLKQKSEAAEEANTGPSACDPTTNFCDYFGNDADVSNTLKTPAPDLTSGVPTNSTLVSPDDVTTVLGIGGNNRPVDPDCGSYTDSELNQMANEASINYGISFQEAYQNLDCPPR